MKSHVTLFTKRCVVCAKEYETGELGLDKRLKDSLDPRTCIGIGVCDEHKIEGTYLIEIDPLKSTWDGKKLVEPYTTGRVLGVSKDAAKRWFNMPEELEFTFMDDLTELFEAYNKQNASQ